MIDDVDVVGLKMKCRKYDQFYLLKAKIKSSSNADEIGFFIKI